MSHMLLNMSLSIDFTGKNAPLSLKNTFFWDDMKSKRVMGDR
jgi:hypothetical protein